MAIKYAGQQKIGYGKAQVFDTSKLADNVKFVGEKLEQKRKQKKKDKAEYLKNMTDIDVSKIRQVDADYITSSVNDVSEYFYKNSAAIMNPKLDGGKASMELQRLKGFAVGEVQKSIGIKEEDKLLNDRINSDQEHFGTNENYSLHNRRSRTAMNEPMWNDRETPVTETEVSTSMTEQEKSEFYSKSKSEQQEILRNKNPMQVALNDYNSLTTDKEKQQFLVNNNYELGDSGDKGDGVDGDFGDKSKEAEELFLGKVNESIESTSSVVGSSSDISGYESYEDYAQNNVGIALNEQEFNNLKADYNAYETTWNESQGTFETKTQGGEMVLGLHSMQLNANPMLGEHIQEVASNIVFNETLINKIGKERIGDGNTNIFEINKEVAREQIIAGVKTSVEGHRFNVEMKKELDAALLEEQAIDPNFTMDDLYLKMAQPFIKNDTDIKFVNDILRTKPTRISINNGNKPKSNEFARPLGQLDTVYKFSFQGGDDGAKDGKIGGGKGNNSNYRFELLQDGTVNGRNVQGVDITQVVGSEGTSKDLLEITTTGKGFRQLGAGEGGNLNNWVGGTGTVTLNPSMIFPSPVFKKGDFYKGVYFEKGDRIPRDVEMTDGTIIDFSSYFPTINDEGEYKSHSDTDISYFIQGTNDKGSIPVIIEYSSQVRKNVESWVMRQTDDKTSITKMNQLLGLPNLGEDRAK